MSGALLRSIDPVVLGTKGTLVTPTPTMQVDGARLARVFPFFLWLDAAGRVIDYGPSLAKTLPALCRGAPMAEHFRVRRPGRAANAADWRRHVGQMCMLVALGREGLSLRGGCEVLEDDSTVLLVSPVVSSLTQLRGLGLGLGDFAPHDAAADLLLLARTMQTSMDDSERLAQRLRSRSEHLNTILELAHNGVLLLGADGRVLHANSALRKLLGLAPEDVPGCTAADLDALLRELLAAGEAWAPCFDQVPQEQLEAPDEGTGPTPPVAPGPARAAHRRDECSARR